MNPQLVLKWIKSSNLDSQKVPPETRDYIAECFELYFEVPQPIKCPLCERDIKADMHSDDYAKWYSIDCSCGLEVERLSDKNDVSDFCTRIREAKQIQIQKAMESMGYSKPKGDK